MAKCQNCGREFDGWLSVLGSTNCSDCRNGLFVKPVESDRTADDEVLATQAGVANVVLSTSAVGTIPDAELLGIVSGTCVFGQHIGRDIMSAWRDLTGGRARAAETVFNDARQAALIDMSAAAAALGATEVFAVHIDHQELGGRGKSMVMVTATGTAIRATNRSIPDR